MSDIFDPISKIINSVYEPHVEAILSAEVSDDGAISGQFFDEGQVFDYEITPDDEIEYQESRSDSEYVASYVKGFCEEKGIRVDSDNPVAFVRGYLGLETKQDAGARKCVNGTPCGGICLPKGKKCRQGMNSGLKQTAAQIRQNPSARNSPNLGKQLLAAGAIAAGVAGAGALAVGALQKKKAEPYSEFNKTAAAAANGARTAGQKMRDVEETVKKAEASFSDVDEQKRKIQDLEKGMDDLERDLTNESRKAESTRQRRRNRGKRRGDDGMDEFDLWEN